MNWLNILKGFIGIQVSVGILYWAGVLIFWFVHTFLDR